MYIYVYICIYIYIYIQQYYDILFIITKIMIFFWYQGGT